MQKNILFRGCTRPPMFMGVPYVPFFIGAGSVILLSFYTNMFFLALLPVVIFVMRQMARRDELIFRLLGLRLQVRRKVRNLGRHEGTWAFSPNAYRDPRAKYPIR
jgi:type IV secretion system protein VirB3